jgi:hypothetical protein
VSRRKAVWISCPARTLLARDFDRTALASQGLKYERLDQLTTDILLGVA